MKPPSIATLQLALGVGVAFVSTVFLATPPFLIPSFVENFEINLTQAGFMAALPNLGMVATLFVWGVLADHYGERLVLILGLALTVATAFGAALTENPVLLGIFFLTGGMTSASANSASGRVVIGWAKPAHRGRAMGIRQMAIPLGVMVAAIGIPPLADTFGLTGALLLPAIVCALMLPCCAIGLRNPSRPQVSPTTAGESSSKPYRISGYLPRVHATSAILAIPQLSLQTFGLVWAMSDLKLSSLAAGTLVGASQFLGALGRVVVGAYSDYLGRLNIIRYVATCNIFAFMIMAVSAYAGWYLIAVIFFVLATCFSVADNGPAFTAVAEFAGPFWSGRALGIQNTSQNVVGFAVGPAVGAMIEITGFPTVFVILALAPAVSLILIPKEERRYDDER